MTRFTIRMSSIHRETDFISIFIDGDVKSAIALDRDFIVTSLGRGFRYRRCEERITTFGAEEVLFVVSAFAECGVVECDEPFVDDWCFAVVTAWGEVLVTDKHQSINKNFKI